jgi:hypothetical protein
MRTEGIGQWTNTKHAIYSSIVPMQFLRLAVSSEHEFRFALWELRKLRAKP